MSIKLILAIIVYSISAVCITITVKNSKAKKLKSYFVEQAVILVIYTLSLILFQTN